MPSVKTKRQALHRGPAIDIRKHVASKIAIFASGMLRSASRFYRESYGIGVVEWRVIMFIGYMKETSANRICLETDLDKGAVSRSLNVLANKGIIRVQEDGEDSRRRNVVLTAKGRALHDRIVPVAMKRQQILLSGLSQSEVEKLLELIARLRTKAAGYRSSREDKRARQPHRRGPQDGSPQRPSAMKRRGNA